MVGFHLAIEVLYHVLTNDWVGFSDLQDLSITHLDYSVGESLETLIVGDHDHCDSVLDVEVDQDLHDDVCGFGVQITGWLIEKED